MSIVAGLRQSFGEPELFAPSGAATTHAELPQHLAQPSLGVPFPVYQQRHSSPYPMSFSSLGPGPSTLEHSPDLRAKVLALHDAQPPSAPKPPLNHLPALTPMSDIVSPPPVHPYDYSLRPDIGGSKLFPDAMIKLAPPADEDGYGYEPEIREVLLDYEYEDGIPRRIPGAAIDLNVGDAEPLVLPPPANHRHSLGDISTIVRSRSDGSKKALNRRSMGAPPKPKRATTAHPGQLPTMSARMEPSRSADSRARLRSNMPARSQTYQSSSAHSTISRGLIDVASSASTPPRPFSLGSSAASIAGEADAPDLGGPEGLEAKVVLLGSQGVGKTSLILRYTTCAFSNNAAPATIGSSLHTRKLVHAGTRVKLQIWDTAGQERFRSMAPIYYRGANVCVLVYDVTDRQSFEDVRSWLEELGRTVPKETAIYVVGAKTDLAVKSRVIS